MNVLMLALVVVLIAVNAFFVVAEYALVRSRRARLAIMRDEGVRGASLALKQLERINEYISTIQIGITITSIGVGAIGEPALASVLRGVVGSTASHGVAVVVAVTVAFAIIACAQLVAGEMVPKFYAIGRAEAIARRVARPLQAFSVFFHPLVVALTALANGILRLFGANMDLKSQGSSEDEIKLLIAESSEPGRVDLDEAAMLTGVFHLHEHEVRQVMTPAPAVVSVDVSEDVAAALALCVSSGHTRLVVTEDGDPDRVRGLVHVNKLVRRLTDEGPQSSFADLVREAMIVPETKPLDDLLADLQRARSSMAVVVDEYGRVVGVAAVEDIVEDIVGEIDDETDPGVEDIRRLPSGDWSVQGHVPLADLADYGLGLPVDRDAYNSVGGFVFSELGHLPEVGDTMTVNGFLITVESVRENRIEAILIHEHHS